MKKTAYSDSFKVFLGLCILLILCNLFWANDYASLWNGTETALMLSAQETAANNPVAFLTEMIYQSVGLRIFPIRLPGVLLLLLTALLFFIYGKKIFGRDAVVLTMLVAASSLLLVPLAKVAGGDVYLLFAQMMHLVFSILFVKQPLPKWRNASYFFLILGMMIHPLAMGIWAAALALLLGFRHKKRANVKALFLPVGAVLVVLPLLANAVWGDWQFMEFSLSFGNWSMAEVYGFMLLGMLPWLGFLPAALVDLYKKNRKGEELAIITTAWLVAAVLSQSMILIIVLSFMIAKQVWVLFVPNYPYLRLVKGFALLNLLSIFGLVFLTLLGGISWVGVDGYRPLLGMSAIYWMFSLLAVLGLFMRDRRVVIGGYVFSGLVVMLIFWTAIYPMWDGYRSLPQKVAKMAGEKNASGVEKLTYYPADWMSDAFKVYANEEFNNVGVVRDSVAFKTQLAKPDHQVFVFDNRVLTEVDSSVLKRGVFFEVKGGWGRMGSGGYVVE